ncbi:MAG: TspO protein [Symploca sp. SIO1B1]|nr:TspO protein [Symploca sp. SIO1B1]
MLIGAVAFAIAFAGSILTPNSRWFRRLRRPRWLTFEWAIPLIWTTIFICGAISAYLVWESAPGSGKSWFLMGFYLCVEIAIMAYTPIMFRLRSLLVGTIIGAIGSILGIILIGNVFPVSLTAGLLLLPYVIWSPIGTYVTWDMIRLNPDER